MFDLWFSLKAPSLLKLNACKLLTTFARFVKMNQRRVESLKTNPLRYATALEGFHVAVLTMEGSSYEDTACPKPRFKLAARGTLADARLFWTSSGSPLHLLRSRVFFKEYSKINRASVSFESCSACCGLTTSTAVLCSAMMPHLDKESSKELLPSVMLKRK